MDSTIQNLPSKSAAAESDILYLIFPGDSSPDRKIRVGALTPGLPLATGSAKGLFSPEEKLALANAVTAVAELQDFTTNTIASATTIALAAGIYSYVLTGTTSVVNVSGAEDYRHYTFYYPSGPGVNMLGEAMLAGDVLEFFSAPS